MLRTQHDCRRIRGEVMQAANEQGYVEIWSSWDLVQPPQSSTQSVELNPCTNHTPSAVSLREQVQIARIEQRLSIADVAFRVKCHERTLAAFERGDEVLEAFVVKKLRSVLKIA